MAADCSESRVGGFWKHQLRALSDSPSHCSVVLDTVGLPINNGPATGLTQRTETKNKPERERDRDRDRDRDRETERQTERQTEGQRVRETGRK